VIARGSYSDSAFQAVGLGVILPWDSLRSPTVIVVQPLWAVALPVESV